MSKEKSNKTLIIILAIVIGLVILAGLGIGGCVWLYNIGLDKEAKEAPDEWLIENTYENARFGFSFNYPKTFTAVESVNGDGVSLTSSQPPISINAYGTANSEDQSLDEYLNSVRADLFKGAENAEETEAKDVTLHGQSASERIWHYISSADGSETILDQITALRNDTFYTIQMIIGFSNYSEYSPMFVDIIDSYRFE
jgi:hypothetical protein